MSLNIKILRHKEYYLISSIVDELLFQRKNNFRICIPQPTEGNIFTPRKLRIIKQIRREGICCAATSAALISNFLSRKPIKICTKQLACKHHARIQLLRHYFSVRHFGHSRMATKIVFINAKRDISSGQSEQNVRSQLPLNYILRPIKSFSF
jgi:hypothetical protein